MKRLSRKSLNSLDMSEDYQDHCEVYAETPNGREIREGVKAYWVQPWNDNYWIAVNTPKRALRAYYHPEEFRAS